jgi:phenylacetate-coenzyme A ligase PaaK-like adenylate-forming protein
MLSSLRIMLAKQREFRRVARMTRADFETYKLGKFRRLVQHAAARSPYYARIITERGIDPGTAHPEDFPPLGKSELMANFDEIATVPAVRKQPIAEFLSHSHDPTELYLGRFRVIHTSGSSGEVGYFVYSPEDWARGSQMRPRGSNVPRPMRKRRGRIRIAYYGATDGHYAGVSMVAAFKQSLVGRLLLDLAIYEINEPLPEVIEALNAFQPEMLLGYTTALKILAEKQREGSLRLNALFGITGAGEVTTEHDRRVLSEAFGCGVTNAYGSSEHLGMGAAMPGNKDMVLYDDELIYELRDDHTLVTNLFNYTVPLIRYRMADILRPLPDMSPYAPYLAVESLVGRSEIQPVFKNADGVDDFISPHTINEIFVPGLNRFQLHLTGTDRFRFLVCLDASLDAAQRAAARNGIAMRLREVLDRKRMPNVDFEVLEVDDLPVNPTTRKFQLIVDERGQDRPSA